MKCPTCEKEFFPETKNRYTAKYCCRSCANTRIFSKDRKQKHSGIMTDHFKNEAPDVRKARIGKSVETKKTKHELKLIDASFDDLSFFQKRKRILSEQNYKCLCCGINQEWMGKSLIFELDHIDGNRKDNSRCNLRMMCPNCHSQTETFVGRNIKKVSDSEILKEINLCENLHQLCKKVGLQPCKRSYDRIKALVAHR